MTPTAALPADALPVVCGAEAADRLVAAGVADRERIVVQHDVLSCGPLALSASLDDWRATREAFWQQVWAGPGCPRFRDFEGDVFTSVPRLRKAPALVLWAGEGVSDQLFLASMPQWLALAGLADLPLWQVAVPGRGAPGPRVAGPGQLGLHAVRNANTPRPVSSGLRLQWQRAWEALCCATPEAWLALLRETGGDERLRAALELLLGRFPAVQSGLTAWDEILVDCLDAQWRDCETILQEAMRRTERALDPVGDVYLFWRLRRMGRGGVQPPLVEWHDAGAGGRRGSARLTDAGLAVRVGQPRPPDRSAIDEQVAGMHLLGTRGAVWYRRGSEPGLVRA